MSQNYYAEIYLHLTWHTKLSRPILNPQVADLTYAALREKASDLGGILIHDIGGIATHVHLSVSIRPTVTISEMIGALNSTAQDHGHLQRMQFLSWMPFCRSFLRVRRI